MFDGPLERPGRHHYMTHAIGFDREKYIELQSEHINARREQIGGKLYLEDLGSLNGTYVNRTLLDGRTVLREGDEIQIGKYRATISLSEPGSN